MLSRRNLLTAAFAGAAGLALRPAGAQPTPTPSGRFRVAFFTDTHLPHPEAPDRDRYRQQERMARAFDLANAYQPSLYLFGGDNVMAVDQGNNEDNARGQFENWASLVESKVQVPFAHAIGNHDIWYPEGAGPADRKALAVEYFQMPNRYFRVEHGGWSFFLLDAFHPDGPTGIDEEQWAWLDEQLGKTNLPTCLVTHTPILSVSYLIDGGGLANPGGLREMFLKRDNVRLALSGHQHHVDLCKYDEVTYLCGGAVSGAWWGGNYQHFPPAFVILDLAPGGEVDSTVVYWETQPGEPPAVV